MANGLRGFNGLLEGLMASMQLCIFLLLCGHSLRFG